MKQVTGQITNSYEVADPWHLLRCESPKRLTLNTAVHQYCPGSQAWLKIVLLMSQFWRCTDYAPAAVLKTQHMKYMGQCLQDAALWHRTKLSVVEYNWVAHIKVVY